MYYPRFTKAIIHYFMSKDPSIPKRNKVNWHYVRDDHMFSKIKLVSRHQNTQQFDALLPIKLTNDAIRNSKAYKEYYAIATGEAAPKPKASVRRTRSSSDTSITPPTAAASPRLIASAKGKQTAKASKASKAKSLPALSEVAMTEAQQLKLVTKRSMQQTHISQPSGSGADEGTGSKPRVLDVPTEESEEELSWNSTDDEGDDNEEKDDDCDEEDEGDDTEEGNGDDDDDDDDDGDREEGDGDDDDQEVGRDDDKDDDEEDSEDKGDDEEDLGLNVGEEERHVEEEKEDELYRDVNINQGRGIQATLEVEDSHVSLTPVNPEGQQESSSVSSICDKIVHQYMEQQMNEAVKVAVQIQSDHRDEAQRENAEFLRTAMNERLEAKILTRSSHSSRTSYVVAADLSEMELKKILIEKIEGNKYIQRSDEQRNLYKALVDAYESDKIILDTYGEIVTLKRRRDDDADKDEETSVGPDRGSKRRREGKEPESASAPAETATRSVGRSTQGSRSRQASASESTLAEEPMLTTSQMEEPSHLEFDTGADDQPIVQSFQHPEWFSQQQKPPSSDRDWNKTMPAVHGSIQPWISELAKQVDTRSSFNELMDTPLDFSNFLINRIKVDTLTSELLEGPTYELMKGSCKSLIELEYHLEEVFKATTDQLDWVNPEGASSRKYTTSIMKMKVADYGHIKWIEDLVPRTMWIEEPIGYDKHALWGEHRHPEACGRPSTGSRSYQKKLNLTKPDSYRSDLKRNEAYTAYSSPRGFIYQNKDKRNRLMRIDELHKFSDGTLTDVRTALDDRLKGIQMQFKLQKKIEIQIAFENTDLEFKSHDLDRVWITRPRHFILLPVRDECGHAKVSRGSCAQKEATRKQSSTIGLPSRAEIWILPRAGNLMMDMVRMMGRYEWQFRALQFSEFSVPIFCFSAYY
nr:hypothetical protein [Tanacetum cinerariifolium]